MDFNFSIIAENWQALASGLVMTLAICGVSIPVGCLIGLVISQIRMRGSFVVRALAIGYVEIFRNIPFLIQVFLLFYVLPFFGVRLTPLMTAFLAMAGYASAYSSEIFRGAINSIPAGQVEAALALGMKYPFILRKILVPQVLGYIIPSTTNLTITLIKESAVLSTVTVAELTYSAQNVVGRTFAAVEMFTTLAIIYWAVTATLSRIMSRLEIVFQPHLAHTRTR